MTKQLLYPNLRSRTHLKPTFEQKMKGLKTEKYKIVIKINKKIFEFSDLKMLTALFVFFSFLCGIFIKYWQDNKSQKKSKVII